MLILGTHLRTNKALYLSLQAIFGINHTSAYKICSIIGVTPKTKLELLNVNQLDKLTQICREEINSNLFRKKVDNIKFLIKIKNYRGVRHMFGLPTRGQKT